ncbi:hypothetical protein BC827DRAFT_1226395 [Russula dissimulans]|nr:hypothetical protein BC827DRAFT_1226395 [Russula dissimulans]
MQSSYSNTPVSDSNVQDSPLAGFNPSLLERMNVDSSGPFQPPSDQNPPQEQNSTSHTRLRSNLSQPLIVGFERGRSTKPFVTQHGASLGFTVNSSPSEPLSNIKFSQPPDEIRASVVPDLRYPNSTVAGCTVHPQPAFVDRDASHTSQSPISRNLLPVSANSAPRFETADGTSDNSTVSLPSASSQHNGATFATEPEKVRRALENLFRLASVREERMSKQREIFDLRSGELSTFGAEASRAIQELQDKTEFLKQQAEEMRAQAEQTLQEASKMRDMADRLIASAGTIGVDTLGAKNHVGRQVERVGQLAQLAQNGFNTLTALRGPEKEKIALVQAEIAAQDLAERARRQQELQQQLERRKIEEQERKEAAKRAEEEQARKKAKEIEAARKRSFDMRRAEVMAEKRRAAEAQAQLIQAESERRIAYAPTPGSGSAVRGSNAPPSVSPGLIPKQPTELRVRVSPSLPKLPTGGVAKMEPPPTHPPPSPNKVKTAPTPVSFVPAQTEAGRAVNTNSPLSSTTLASELHARNVVEAPKQSHLNQATHDLAQEQRISERPRRSAPTSESHPVQVKREPFVEEPSVLQPLPDLGDTVQSQRHQQAAPVRTTSQDRRMDQHVPASSTSESRATSMHITQVEDHHLRSNPSERVPLQDDRRHTQDPSHDHVVPSRDGRAYRRQDSVLSDLSASRGPSSRSRSNSRSPYPRKRMRSRTPPRHGARYGGDHWVPGRPRVRPRFDDRRGRSWRPDGYNRARQGDDTYYRRRPPPPRRTPEYRSSRSPPPSPRQFRNERSPPPRSYRDRPILEYSQRFANLDSGIRGAEEYRTSVNPRHYDLTHEDAHRTTDEEEQARWQQQQQQRLMPSSSERDQTSTPSPRQRGIEIGLLDRINMNEADDRGYEGGRPPVGPTRGGPNSRRGMRGTSSSRGRGSAPGSTPVLLSRMTESTQHPTRTIPAPSLSDRLQQD